MPKIIDRDEQRQKLAQITAQQIAQHGLANTSMRGIAKAAGYTTGVLQHYFKNRDELIYSALKLANKSYSDRVANIIGDQKGLKAIRIRLEQSLPLTIESRKEWQIRLQCWAHAALDKNFSDNLAKLTNNWRELHTEDLQWAQQENEISANIDVSLASHRLWLFVMGVGIDALIDPTSFSATNSKVLVDNVLQDLALV